MKLKYKFEKVNIDGKNVMVPVEAGDFVGLINLNEVSTDIFELLKEDTTENNVVEEMMKLYNASEADIRRNVTNVLETLRAENLLLE